MKIGYARVSTADQNLDMQMDALKKAGCEEIYTDVISGSKSDRPGLNKALAYIRDGDSLVVWRLDRLGRSIKHLIETVNGLEKKGIAFNSLQENIDTSTSSGKLTFHLFSALAEFERDIIIERTEAGLKLARERGKFGGRPRVLDDKEAKCMIEMYDARNTTVADICKIFGISRPTLYKYVRDREKYVK